MALATEVFTPTAPAQLTFVERQKLNDQLVDALRTPGKQVIVYGQSGSGKTTLLENKLRQLYSNHIRTQCTAASTFESILLSGFDKLNPFYTETFESKKSRKVSGSLLLDYRAIKAGIAEEWTREEVQALRRALPLQLTPERLAQFVGEAECCWVIEDFHKTPAEEKVKLAQILKTFMDAAAEYPRVKIVAIGAVDTARQVVEYDPEMRNRVAEVLVPLMERHELVELMTKGERHLNFRLGTGTKDQVAKYSSGLASVCHQLCLNLCFSVGIEETLPESKTVTTRDLEAAVERYLSDSSDTLKAVWDSALRSHRARRYDNCRMILKALVEGAPEGETHSEILGKIRKEEPDYPSGNLTTYLRELREKGRRSILSFDPCSLKYSFANPLYRAYGVLLFEKPRQRAGLVSDEIENILLRLLSSRASPAILAARAVLAAQHDVAPAGRPQVNTTALIWNDPGTAIRSSPALSVVASVRVG